MLGSFQASDRAAAAILHTNAETDLQAITRPEIQAIICLPSPLPAWIGVIAEAVEAGRFVVPRARLLSADRTDIKTWLDVNLPHGVVSDHVLEALKADILRLAGHVYEFEPSTMLQMRIFTEKPTTECGFHVDTVPRGAPTCGLLRVYNGAGTDYVEAGDVRSADHYFHYLGRRERLARERREARAAGDRDASRRSEEAIVALDRARPFVQAAAVIRVAPAGSIVAFKHVDIGTLWSTLPENAWVHCSPMEGKPRLVLNLSAVGRAHRSSVSRR
jgi:hypothetical protein